MTDLRHILSTTWRHGLRSLRVAAAVAVVAVLLASCGAEKHVKKGDAFYAIGEYYDAAAEYKKAYARTAIKEKEKRGERAWKMAEAYRRMNYTAKAAGKVRLDDAPSWDAGETDGF